MKRLVKILAINIFTFALLAAMIPSKSVEAAGTEGLFEMNTGGSIRLTAPYGLRFRVKMSADVKSKAEKVGMLIFPADYLVNNGTDGDVYYESVEALAEANVAEHRIDLDLTSKLYEKDSYWYGNGAIVNIKEGNMAREFVGIAYYKVDGDITFADTSKLVSTTRSAAQVALLGHADKTCAYSDESKVLLLKYIDYLKTTDVVEDAPTRYQVRGYAADNGLHIHAVQYVDNVVTTGDEWKEQTHLEAQIWQHNIGYGVENGLDVDTYCAFFLNGDTYFNNLTNINGITNTVTIEDKGEGYTEAYRYEIRYEIFIEFDNNLTNPQNGPYAFVQFKHHLPGETEEGFENAYQEYRDESRYLWQDNSSSYEFRKVGIIAKNPKNDEADFEELLFDFPTIKDFANINSDLQSVDPELYNFQMWTTDTGLYTYFTQTVSDVTLNDSNNWNNTHVEMELWNGDVGNGMNGTYIALFPDETVYINNLNNVRSVSLQVKIDESDASKIVLEYYFHLEFDNNTMNYESSYAYVKIYQFLPGVSTTGLHSQVITRDGRQLLTGTEKSFQVHNTIDKKMYE